MAPVTAAVAVIALAVSLVMVGMSNGTVVPRQSASPSTVPPQYYVGICGGATGWYGSAPLTSTKEDVPPNHLVVGDTFTGKSSATIAAPTGTAWTGGSTAAADDRTFVALGRSPTARRPRGQPGSGA